MIYWLTWIMKQMRKRKSANFFNSKWISMYLWMSWPGGHWMIKWLTKVWDSRTARLFELFLHNAVMTTESVCHSLVSSKSCSHLWDVALPATMVVPCDTNPRLAIIYYDYIIPSVVVSCSIDDTTIFIYFRASPKEKWRQPDHFYARHYYLSWSSLYLSLWRFNHQSFVMISNMQLPLSTSHASIYSSRFNSNGNVFTDWNIDLTHLLYLNIS